MLIKFIDPRTGIETPGPAPHRETIEIRCCGAGWRWHDIDGWEWTSNVGGGWYRVGGSGRPGRDILVAVNDNGEVVLDLREAGQWQWIYMTAVEALSLAEQLVRVARAA